MCGIVAYTGHQKCASILIKGLERLEYRGYDSAGIALLENGLRTYKKEGKVSVLANALAAESTSSCIGIGHTRWATHGAPSDANAHPQVAASGSMAIVHNGIIENYNTLKENLLSKGYTFQSETDTEVLAHFIEDVQKQHQCSLEQAIRLALTQVVGAYAIVVLSEDLPNTLIAAKKGSPMVIGIGENEFFIASDATPIIEHTNQVIFLNDHEIATIHQGQLTITTLEGGALTPEIQQLDMALETIEKSGFDHFMLKEIFEQPKAINDCLRGRLDLANQRLVLGGVSAEMEKVAAAQKITIVACGTSYYAGLVAEYFIEEFCRIPVEVEYASEFRYKNPIIEKGAIVLAISQSGETADTLAAVELAKLRGATVLGVCNVVGSTIARTVHAGIYTHAGPEIGVASTKAFNAQLTVLMMIALDVARRKQSLSPKVLAELLQILATIPDVMSTVLQQHKHIKSLAEELKEAANFLYLGRGHNFPVALEGALKLKEISYIHAEGYPAAEMKHGPIALIDEKMPVLFIAPQDRSYDKIISNIETVKARGGQVIIIATKGDTRALQFADHIIEVPSIHEAFMPMIAVIPLQLLAYYIATLRGCNVDQPRNLAKSVTVE